MTDADSSEPDSDRGESTRRLAVAALVAAAVAAIIAVVALLFIAFDDDDEAQEPPASTTTSVDTTSTSSSSTSSTTSSTTTSTSSTTSSSTSSTTSSTTSEPPSSTSTIPPAISSAVWPWFESGLRYVDPVAAARGFSEEYVGMEAPLVGEYLPGDSRSGEVEIRAVEDGAVTVVFVRQLGDDDFWWVIGSATENIEVDSPAALEQIDDPLRLSGRARAFEGTVQVALRVDGQDDPLAETVLTASGDEELRSFEGELSFDDPDTGWGAVVFYTESAEDGRIYEAGVVRVEFG